MALGWRFTSIPRFQKTIFKVGHVLTVEPGLYYPGLGGVRTEDLVAVTKSGIEMLSRFRASARALIVDRSQLRFTSPRHSVETSK